MVLSCLQQELLLSILHVLPERLSWVHTAFRQLSPVGTGYLNFGIQVQLVLSADESLCNTICH